MVLDNCLFAGVSVAVELKLKFMVELEWAPCENTRWRSNTAAASFPLPSCELNALADKNSIAQA